MTVIATASDPITAREIAQRLNESGWTRAGVSVPLHAVAFDQHDYG